MKRDEAYYFLKNRGYSSVKKISMLEARNLLNDFLLEPTRFKIEEETDILKETNILKKWIPKH